MRIRIATRVLAHARIMFRHILQNALTPIIVHGFNVLGDWLRDRLDPRMRT